MKRIIYLVVLLLIFANTHAQTGKIAPGNSHFNSSSDTVFYMPKTKVIEFKVLKTKYSFCTEKIKKYDELVLNLERRIFLADSTIALKRIEADIWYSKLQSNDINLEQQRILNLKLNDDKDRLRKSRVYYFVGGVIATSIVFIAVK